jgi:hypothetical protein
MRLILLLSDEVRGEYRHTICEIIERKRKRDKYRQRQAREKVKEIDQRE